MVNRSEYARDAYLAGRRHILVAYLPAAVV
jgi:hypothetical protein